MPWYDSLERKKKICFFCPNKRKHSEQIFVKKKSLKNKYLNKSRTFFFPEISGLDEIDTFGHYKFFDPQIKTIYDTCITFLLSTPLASLTNMGKVYGWRKEVGGGGERFLPTSNLEVIINKR